MMCMYALDEESKREMQRQRGGGVTEGERRGEVRKGGNRGGVESRREETPCKGTHCYVSFSEMRTKSKRMNSGHNTNTC